MLKLCRCGKETNSKDGICAGCRIEMSYAGPITEPVNIITAETQKHNEIEEEIEDMSTLTKEKICVDCHKPYEPTSNVQKRCPECKAKHKPSVKPKKRKEERGKRKEERASPLQGSTAASHAADSAGKDGNGKYPITLDMAWYPKLREKIAPLGCIDTEMPERVIMALIHKHFTDLEARIEK